MTTEEAAAKLRQMYTAAPRGEKAFSVILFGLMYVDDLEGLSIPEVVRMASITPGNGYGTHVHGGMSVAWHLRRNPGLIGT